jgi:hypothetical protein
MAVRRISPSCGRCGFDAAAAGGSRFDASTCATATAVHESNTSAPGRQSRRRHRRLSPQETQPLGMTAHANCDANAWGRPRFRPKGANRRTWRMGRGSTRTQPYSQRAKGLVVLSSNIDAVPSRDLPAPITRARGLQRARRHAERTQPSRAARRCRPRRRKSRPRRRKSRPRRRRSRRTCDVHDAPVDQRRRRFG